MEKPLVTVGVASFNNADYLVDTLESIRQQDYPNWELIIVDDCSRDNSVEVAQNWLIAHPEVRGKIVLSNSNQGICATFNKSVQLAQGKYYSLIGSDDLYLPDKLSRQVAELEKLSAEYAVVYGDITNIDETGQPLFDNTIAGIDEPHPEGEVYEAVLRRNFIPAMGQLVRVQVFEQVGLYDETLAYEDWDMWLRITKTFKVKYLPGVVARYRLHQRSISVARRLQLIESSTRLLEKHTGQNPRFDHIIAGHLAAYAEAMAWAEDPAASRWLWRALTLRPQLRPAALLALTASGLSLNRVYGWYTALRRRLGRTSPDNS